jgi:hypothetical protein
MTHAPVDRGLVHGADAMRVRQHHRAFEQTGFLDPGAARHLAGAIQDEAAGESRRCDRVAAARQDRGDAGAHFVAVREILDQRHLADRHAATSVIALRGPGLPSKGTPMSRARVPAMGNRNGKSRKQCQDVTNRAESDSQMMQPRRDPGR